MNLRRCPCGKVPDGFGIRESDSHRWRIAEPDCCGMWMFEFRVEYPTTDEQIQQAAAQAWNDMPREGE